MGMFAFNTRLQWNRMAQARPIRGAPRVGKPNLAKDLRMMPDSALLRSVNVRDMQSGTAQVVTLGRGENGLGKERGWWFTMG